MDDFWIVTTAAATVATAISTSVTLWLRQRDKPEAAWEVLARASYRVEEGDHDLVTLTNAGDGAAYQVQVTGRDCFVERVFDRARSDRPSWLEPVVQPGDVLEFRVFHAGRPIDARLRIAWVPAPTRVSRTIIEVIPLVEASVLAASGRRTGPSDWRYRELPWWRLLQRRRQWASRRAKERARVRTAREAQAMHQWRQRGREESQQDSAAGTP